MAHAIAKTTMRDQLVRNDPGSARRVVLTVESANWRGLSWLRCNQRALPPAGADV